MSEQHQRKRGNNRGQAGGVVKKSKESVVLHEGQTTLKNSVAQSIQPNLAQAESAKAQPTQQTATPKSDHQKRCDEIFAEFYRRHPNARKRGESTSSKTPAVEPVAVTLKGDGQSSADGLNSGKQDVI